MKCTVENASEKHRLIKKKRSNTREAQNKMLLSRGGEMEHQINTPKIQLKTTKKDPG